MSVYKKPAVSTYGASEFTEVIGPVQAASIEVDGYRGTKLEDHSRSEYRYVCNQKTNSLVQIDKEGGIKNA